jgi:hypothetical protein
VQALGAVGSAFFGELHDETQHAGANEGREDGAEVEPGEGTVGARTVEEKAANEPANHANDERIDAALFLLTGNRLGQRTANEADQNP